MVKVGDKVKLLRSDTFGDFCAGDIVEVTGVCAGGVYFDDAKEDERYIGLDEIEPVNDTTEYKKGDRVRLVKDGLSTTGAVGKLATIDSWASELKSLKGEYLLKIDPPVDYKTLACTPEYTRATADCFVLADDVADSNSNQTGITIKAGHYYKTRDGFKVGPAAVSDDYEYPWRASGALYMDNGRWLNDDIEDDNDLIAEWHDEPAATATGAPKFKVGDRVATDGGYTFDPNEGVIVKNNVDDDDDLYKVDVPSTDSFDGDGWHYRAHQLRLVAEATSGKDSGGTPTPTAGFTVPLAAPEFAAKVPSSSDLLLARKMVRAGIYTVNEVRETIGLKPIFNGYDIAA